MHDKTWVYGGTNPGKLTFQQSGIDTVSMPLNPGTGWQWACVSSAEGEFEFFTNGIYVYNADGTQMVNGNALADNNVNTFFDEMGLPDNQNVLVIPKKGSQYYIMYQSVSDPLFANQQWVYTNHLHYSVVDMSLQNGKGEVIEKKTNINSGQFMDGHMTACQHANGRDWWLVQRRWNGNGYHVYLVTPDSISYKGEQFIGAQSQEPDAVGQSAFSADGSKYATVTGKGPLIILDFDRCEGLFSNAVNVHIPLDTFMFYGVQKITGGGGNGLCFSPNNRYLYFSTIYTLRQYDLETNPVDSSSQLLFFWTDSNETHGQFEQMHLAPDGKVYAANYQGFTKAFHVINNPDSVGSACGFVKWGLPLTTNSARVIPNMLHFRMGALVGSGCDTLETGIDDIVSEKQSVRIYPNPARDVVDIDLMSYNQYHPQQQLHLYNTQGQLVKQVALPYLNAQFRVDDLPAGTYQWCLAVHTETRGEGKLVVED